MHSVSQAEDTDLRLSLPECHPSRYPLLTLAKDYQNIKLPPDVFLPGESQGAPPPPKPAKPRWRNITHAEWVGTLAIDSSVVSRREGEGKKKRERGRENGFTKSRMIHRRNTDSRLRWASVSMATGGRESATIHPLCFKFYFPTRIIQHKYLFVYRPYVKRTRCW